MFRYSEVKMMRISTLSRLQYQVICMLFGILMIAGCAGGQPALREAYELLNSNKGQAAVAACKKLLEKEPKMSEAWSCLGKAKMQQGLIESSLGDFDRAIEFAKAKDSIGSYHFYRGLAQYYLGKTNEAIRDFERSVTLQYQPGTAMTYVGICHSMKGDDIQAISWMNKAVKSEPENHFALSNRGFYNAKVGDNKQAVADFSRAISIKPNDKVSYLNRGYTHIGLGDYATAIQDFQKALEIDPNYGGALAYMGIALTNTGQPQEALPYLDKAVLAEPQSGAYHYYRAVAHFSSGMLAEGCEDLQLALERGDNQGAALGQQYCK